MPFENLPRNFKDLPKFDFKFDREFDFRDFKRLAPQWREFLPRFKDGDDDDRKDEKKEEKKDKKDRKKDDEKKKF